MHTQTREAATAKRGQSRDARLPLQQRAEVPRVHPGGLSVGVLGVVTLVDVLVTSVTHASLIAARGQCPVNENQMCYVNCLKYQ